MYIFFRNVSVPQPQKAIPQIPVINPLIDLVFKVQKQSPEVFYKKDVLKNIAKFTEKQTLTQVFSSEFGEFLRTSILKNSCKRLLLKVSLARSLNDVIT